MASLTLKDKAYLEKYLQMESGFCLDFGNDRLQEFILKYVNIDIYSSKYQYFGDSKAKRIRAFWEVETNYNVALLMKSFIEYYEAGTVKNPSFFNATEELKNEVDRIINSLLENNEVTEIKQIMPVNNDRTSELLVEEIRNLISKNQPEVALDRLHTYYMSFVRGLCNTHSINFNEKETLNAIFGKYVKFIEKENIVESEMTISILKYSISLLDKFNHVRNNGSLAHDNTLLNTKESMFILDILIKLKNYIDNIEYELKDRKRNEERKQFNIDLLF